MGKEIEYKHLVISDSWKERAEPGVRYAQAYICAEPDRTVRARIAGEKGILTIKGAAVGVTRSEFEYEIPVADAEQMMRELVVTPIVEKLRYRVEHEGHIWEVDEFLGLNAGLIVAEIELASEDERYAVPEWAGENVSDDSRYTNARLAVEPYSSW